MYQLGNGQWANDDPPTKQYRSALEAQRAMMYLTDDIDPRYTDNTTDITFSAYVIVDDDPAPPSDWTDDANDPSWQTYERGNVFAVIITSETDDHVDSVWDIYDDDYHPWRHDSYTCETARDMLQSAVEQYRETGGWVTI